MLWLLPILFCFNPHSCTRSDSLQRNLHHLFTGFNPHSCTRSDYVVMTKDGRFFRFNPHSCTRSDNGTANITTANWGFNPHSCTRSDIDTCLYVLLTLVSIHTPVQGVTSLQVVCFTFQKFQSTLLYKEWPSIGILIIRHLTFQSTLLYKEWLLHQSNLFESSFVSIHTPVQGVTSWCTSLFLSL